MFFTRLDVGKKIKFPHEKCFQSAWCMKKYILQLVTIHVRKLFFSCIEPSEIHFLYDTKNVRKFFIFSMNAEKKSWNVENKVKIQFWEISTFSEKTISLCSVKKKVLSFGSTLKKIISPVKTAFFWEKKKNFTSQKFCFFQLARQIKIFKITFKNIIFQCFTHFFTT